MKKQKPELVNLAELARRAGVGPAAVSQFLRKQEALGSPVPTTPSAHRREKLVDVGHPLIQAYLKNQTVQPSNRGEGQPLTDAALEKLAALTEKTELSAAVLRGRYISRDLVLQAMDELQRIQKRELDAMVDRIVAKLSKEFGPIDNEQLDKIQKVLKRPCDDALELCSREIKKFRDDTKPRNLTAESAPASKRKHGKKK